MRYTIDIHRYDYFAGASKHEYRSYTNLLEFWSEYKRISANDYNYDDAWQNTTYFVTHDDTVVLKPQRHHAHTKHEWEICNKQQLCRICYLERYAREMLFRKR